MRITRNTVAACAINLSGSESTFLAHEFSEITIGTLRGLALDNALLTAFAGR